MVDLKSILIRRAGGDAEDLQAHLAEFSLAAVVLQAQVAFQRPVRHFTHLRLIGILHRLPVEHDANLGAAAGDLQRVPLLRQAAPR